MNNVYFSIGDAVAGLGIFLLIPQFLKPIYVFRLRVIGIGLRTLYAAAALGFMCVMIAAIVPNFDNIRPAFLGVSLVWEVIGGLLYATSYSALGWVYIFPARVSPRSITKYVRAGANLLASGTEGDRVEFAADVLANIKRLIRIADRPSASEHASHAANDSAACSESFLRLLADPVFCKTLVVNLPWDAARLLRAFSEERPKAQVGRAFVHQITREWFVSTESTGASEVDWRGFSDTPELPDAAFGDRFLSRHYLPWESLTASDIVTIDVGLLDRIYRATRLTIDEEIADRFSVQSYNVARLQESFEALSRRLYLLKKAEQDVAPCANILGHAVKYVVERTRKYCATAKGADGKALYAQADTVAGFSALDSIAEMVITVLENTAYEFGGFDDKFWPMAREIWDSVLPRFGAQEKGMDALQQRVTLKLIEKLKESMEGFYSPLSRQALAIIGPYTAKGETGERTAFKICRDLFYRELKAFPAFFEKDPERATSLLPNNVRYDPATAELIHRYSFGQEDRTNLCTLEIAEEALIAESMPTPQVSGKADASAATPG